MFEIFADRLGRGTLAIPQPFDTEVAEALERTALGGTPRIKVADIGYCDLKWVRGWCVAHGGTSKAVIGVRRDTVGRLVFDIEQAP